MRYLGFDCHKQVHTWALLNPDGGLAEEGAVLNAPRELRELRATFGHEVRVAFEGPRALRAAIETVFADLPCYEVCAAWTHERRRHGRPKPKNDRHDARRVAKALYEESDQLVPLRPPHPERDALTIALQLYRRTAKDHRAAAQRFHELLTRLWQSASTRIFRDPLGATARRFFREYPHPHQAAAARKLGPRLRGWSRGQMDLLDAQRIRSLARDFAPPHARRGTRRR